MNRRQLQKLGIPPLASAAAVDALREAAQQDLGFGLKGNRAKQLVREVASDPQRFVDDAIWGVVAKLLLGQAHATQELEDGGPLPARCDYRTWGDEIDRDAHRQMEAACRVPSARQAALMADAHVGYGLPIGGVLACEGAVIPYAVGVDIACRMKLSVLDLPVDSLEKRRDALRHALEKGTRFGVGCTHKPRQDHEVMDRDWGVCRTTREKKDTAWNQLGTSGSGNHFVEFGTLSLAVADAQLGLDAGVYLALLSHSGSRGAGAAVCGAYSQIAQQRLPPRYRELGRLAWLDLHSEPGQEYWAAMNLMGEYAAANHAVIHRLVCRLAGAHVLAGVENHHNFAWLERHGDRDLVVHRKGATPAGQGVLGVIPGSMADPAFVVRGLGEPTSLASASHGAGRCMSRRAANQQFRINQVRKQLAAQGIDVLSAGSDEVPGVYKDIRKVMAAQSDLVDVVAQFDPKLVKMCGDGSRPED
ncbi:MAG: RtcB family protein [Planctomycetales bacterium]|nr:RtcB family protein [Planctomycetales bacterium]